MKKREPRTVDELKFSKTTLTDLENEKTCPTRWKGQHLDFTVTFEPTAPMLKGLYFEQQAIGRGVAEEEEYEWPTFKGVELDRCDNQVERFKMAFDPNSDNWNTWDITDIQVAHSNDRIKGVWDMEAVSVFDKKGVIDLKFTKNINGRPPYSYAHLDQMDHVQLIMYKELHRDLYGMDCDTYYYVADYSPQENILFKKLKFDDYDIEEMYARVDEAFDLLRWYEKKGYPFNPSERECSRCNLECKFRYE